MKKTTHPLRAIDGEASDITTAGEDKKLETLIQTRRAMHHKVLCDRCGSSVKPIGTFVQMRFTDRP
jgi:hypothetical protein